MKTLSMILLLTLSKPILATEIRCLSASGYYGNFFASINEEKVIVVAAQGFAHELAGKLDLEPSDLHSIKMTFPASACVQEPRKLTCKAEALPVTFEAYEQREDILLNSYAEVQVLQTGKVGRVSITLSGQTQSRTFGDLWDSDGCSFSNQ